MMVRQGDVLLIPTGRDALERAGLVGADREGDLLVLVRGETGHAHAVRADDARLLRSAAPSDDDVLDVPSGAQLVHDEHTAIEIEPGTYLVRRQREYADDAPGSFVIVAD